MIFGASRRILARLDGLSLQIQRLSERLLKVEQFCNRETDTFVMLSAQSDDTRDECCRLDFGRTWDEQIEWMRLYGDKIAKALDDAGHSADLLQFSPQIVAAALILGIKPDADELARAREARRIAHLESEATAA